MFFFHLGENSLIVIPLILGLCFFFFFHTLVGLQTWALAAFKEISQFSIFFLHLLEHVKQGLKFECILLFLESIVLVEGLDLMGLLVECSFELFNLSLQLIILPHFYVSFLLIFNYYIQKLLDLLLSVRDLLPMTLHDYPDLVFVLIDQALMPIRLRL